jgi:spore coat polysaccharide biosynthesis protein SpsF (cytidylyltransferase family)
MVITVPVDWEPRSERPLGKFKKPSVKVKAFIQARKTSSRLPNKIYMDIGGAPMLYHVVDRVNKCKLVDDVVLCAPHELDDIPEGVKQFVWQDDEADVLSRYYRCLEKNPADYVLRITSDCPLLDPHLIDFVINAGLSEKADYCSNVLSKTFPDGVDCELISRRLLAYLHATMNSEYQREHVTIGLRESKSVKALFKCVSVECLGRDFSNIKWSVDDEIDLERVRRIYE